jgi:hypothetical protein
MSQISVLVIIFSFVIAFQNCSGFHPLTHLGPTGGGTFASTGGTELQPATDKIDSSCLVNAQFDACVFRKNPVAVNGAIFSSFSELGIANLDLQQTYGVKLTGLKPNGGLDNGTIRIQTLTGQPILTTSNNLRYRATGDQQQLVTQLHIYYWLTRTIEYIESRTGILPAKSHSAAKPITVYIDDSFAGWAPSTRSIHLKRDGSGHSMAWSAELAIYFFGLANLQDASDGAIGELGNDATNDHRDCGLKKNGCCQSSAGCGRAVASGVGDYFSAMIFPDRPIIGESWENSLNGLSPCSIPRDLGSAAARTALAVFNACAVHAAPGEVTTMGIIYASIWWEVRKEAQAQWGEAGAQELDTLFMRHLYELTGTDNFRAAILKAQSIDSRLHDGKFSALFDSQLTARGL